MKVSAEKLNKTQAQIVVEVPEEQFEASLQKAYQIVVKKVNIPGFRKGKAPRRILENIYGREALLEEALQDAVPKAYFQALEQLKDEYTAVSDPQYDVVQTEKGQPLIFKATFDLKPEVGLGEYKGLELEKSIKEIKAEDIDGEVAKIQQRYAKLAVIEGPAEKGDVLSIDFQGKVDGQPFPGGTGENYPLELGSQTFIPGFEEQLTGIKQGETKDVIVTFPEDYHAQELAAKEAVFTVTVKEIKRKEMANLDDEFAKDVSEFATMQELRNDIENKLKETAAKKSEQELRDKAIKAAVEKAEVELPASMVENRVNHYVQDMAGRLQQQGISFEYYLNVTNKTLEEVRDSFVPGAEASIKADLVLEAVAKAEGIKAEPEDVDKEIAQIAEHYKQEPAKVRETLEKQGQISSLEFGIMIDKAADFIIKEAIITEKSI